MCAVSAVGDRFADRWDHWPGMLPQVPEPREVRVVIDGLTDAERKAFRDFILNDLPEFRRLLEEARRQDEADNASFCADEESTPRSVNTLVNLGLKTNFSL